MKNTITLKVNVLNFFWMFVALQPVLIPFSRTRGLNMTEIFTVQTVFSLTLSLLDVPTGYFADRFGRKLTLLLASLFKGIGTTLVIFANGFWMFALAFFMLGVANAFFSGCDIAYIYECSTSQSANEKFFSSKFAYSMTGGAISALLGGALSAYSLDWVANFDAVVGWTPLFLTLLLPTEDRTQHKSNSSHKLTELYSTSRELLKNSGMLIYKIVVLNVIPIVAGLMFQRYWEAINVPLILFGTATALFTLAGALASNRSEKIEKKYSEKSLLRLIDLLPLFGFVIGLVSHSYLSTISMLFFQIQLGLSQSIYVRKVNRRIENESRATMNSLTSFLTRISISIIGPGIGYLADTQDPATALWSLCAGYLLAMAIPRLKGIFLRGYRK